MGVPLARASRSLALLLKIQVIPFKPTAILLLFSRYSRIEIKVLWLTCLGSDLFNSGTVITDPGILISAFSTIKTVLKVGECAIFWIWIAPFILITFCYKLITIRYKYVNISLSVRSTPIMRFANDYKFRMPI